MTDFWPPSASLDALRVRAGITRQIREFFDSQDVMEVDTPLLCQYTTLDPHLDSIQVHYQHQLVSPLSTPAEDDQSLRFLQTSPEFAMKRLLAAGSGSIYQLTKAFRLGEVGRHHNPEFGILEWYQVGLEYRQLMEEVAALVTQLFASQGQSLEVETLSYQAVFENTLGLNPHICSDELLKERVGLELDAEVVAAMGRDEVLDYLFAFQLEPTFQPDQLTFVYDYPLSQSPLAKQKITAPGAPLLAERFEVFVAGMELGNGYSELTDWQVQQQRFQVLQQQRQALGKSPLSIDPQLISALKHGLPDCAGVALGMDRLMMAMTGGEQISDVIAFPFQRA